VSEFNASPVHNRGHFGRRISRVCVHVRACVSGLCRAILNNSTVGESQSCGLII